jgi:hypothetical protein
MNRPEQVVGHFNPPEDHSQYSELEPQISEDELDGRERIRGGRSLTEILIDLEKPT